MRRLTLCPSLLLGLLFLLLPISLAACGDEAEKRTSSKEANKEYDRRDPNAAGCSNPALIQSGAVSDVPGSRQPVKLSDGKVLGTLTLRRSTKCQTMWGRVDGLPKTPTGYDEMYVAVTRPEDKKTASFKTKDVFMAVFGDMLSYQGGCIKATAYVIRRGQKGPTAVTPCKT